MDRAKRNLLDTLPTVEEGNGCVVMRGSFPNADEAILHIQVVKSTLKYFECVIEDIGLWQQDKRYWVMVEFRAK